MNMGLYAEIMIDHGVCVCVGGRGEREEVTE